MWGGEHGVEPAAPASKSVPPRTSLAAPAERQNRGRALDAGTAGGMGASFGHRLAVIHAGFALDSARSGRFAAASGQLHVFLHKAGERPRQIDVH